MGPLPLSSFDSTTIPFALLLGLAFNSKTSACNKIRSSRLSIPCPVLADTSAKSVSPPQSSDTSPISDNSLLTLSGSASALSILLTATIIGTSAAFAWFTASTVCGITPSSAATTKITTSVILAPLALMAVNASWPGVSIKVTFLSWTETLYAPICWVMPPASPSTTFVLRIVSSSVVLPWSTWPMTVTTGYLAILFESSSAICSTRCSSSSKISTITS